MLITIQIPICDLRDFSVESIKRLARPHWPNPIGGDFIRSAGQIVRNDESLFCSWMEENTVCEFNNACKFIDDIRNKELIPNVFLSLKSRRFYFDGEVVGKFEFIFKIKVKWSKYGQGISIKNFNKLLREIFLLKVKVPYNNSFRETKLIHSGKYLAEFYFKASIPYTKKLLSKQNVYVKHANPLIFIESLKLLRLDKNFKKMPFTFDSSTLYHKWETFNNIQLRYWFQHVGKLEKRNELKISLLRLHASREVLQVILNSIRNNLLSVDSSYDSSYLNFYLNTKIDKYFEIPSEFQNISVLETAYNAEKLVFKSNFETIYNCLQEQAKLREIRQKELQKYLDIRREIVSNFTFNEKVEVKGGNIGDNGVSYSITEILQDNSQKQQLITEMDSLLSSLKNKAESPNELMEVANLANAKLEIENGNIEEAKPFLSKLGKWSLDNASKIGVGVALAFIKNYI